MAASKRNSRKRKASDMNTSSTDTDDVSIEHEQPRKKRKLSNSDYRDNDDDDEDDIKRPSKRDCIQFDIRSWAWMDTKPPYKSHIKLTNNKTQSGGLKTFDLQNKRGHRIIVIDGISGDIEQSIAFDTWADIYAGIRLNIFLKTLQFKPNKWVIVITHDSGYNINAEVAFYPTFTPLFASHCNG